MTSKLIEKLYNVIAMLTMAIFALAPTGWQPRTALSLRFDQFRGYFAMTFMVCRA